MWIGQEVQALQLGESLSAKERGARSLRPSAISKSPSGAQIRRRLSTAISAKAISGVLFADDESIRRSYPGYLEQVHVQGEGLAAALNVDAPVILLLELSHEHIMAFAVALAVDRGNQQVVAVRVLVLRCVTDGP